MISDHTLPLGAAIIRRHLAFATRGTMAWRARHAAAFASRHTSFVNRLLRRWWRQGADEGFSPVWPFDADDNTMAEERRYRVTPDTAPESLTISSSSEPTVEPIIVVGTRPSRDSSGTPRPIVRAQRSTETAVESDAGKRPQQADVPIRSDQPTATLTPEAPEAVRLHPVNRPSTAGEPFAGPVVTPHAESPGETPALAHAAASHAVVRAKRIAGAIPAIRALSRSERTPVTRPLPDRGEQDERLEFERTAGVESAGHTDIERPLHQRPTVGAREASAFTVAASGRAVEANDPSRSPSLAHAQRTGKSSTRSADGAVGPGVRRAGRPIGAVTRTGIRVAERGALQVHRAPSVAVRAPSGFASPARVHPDAAVLRTPFERHDVTPSRMATATTAISQRAVTLPPSTAGALPAAHPAERSPRSSPLLAGMTLDELVEHVVRRLGRQVAIEAERRGVSSWRSRS